MARPAGYQWEPLGWDTDPVPGDPQVISAEAAHLAQVAKEITGQVAALRQISADGVQIGQSPAAIRSAASALAGQLVKVAGRYEQVAAALRGWGPELEQAQHMSVQALDQAEIPYARLNQPAILPSGTNLTAAQQQEIAAYHVAMLRAQDQLAAAKALLGRAIQQRDTQAAYYRAKIGNASHDALTDSWWDHVESWVDHHAGMLRDICTVLEYVATGLALAALIFSGVGILVVLGIGATALALAGRTLLAATGNGSWFDVASDALALVLFGSGKFAGKLMQSTYDVTARTGNALVEAAREASPIGRAGSRLVMAADLIDGNQVVSRGVALLDRIGLPRVGDSVAALASRAGTLMAKAGGALLEKASPSLDRTLAAVPEEVKPVEVILHGGEKESLLLTRKMTAIAARFPRSEAIGQLNARFGTYLATQRVIFGTETVTDLGDKIASVTPGTESYRSFKDSLTTPGGLSTAQANDAVNVLQFVPVLGTAPVAFRAVAGGGW